ncbi:molybdate ABC transporter substrate-binding protein [Microbulbifer pacificus]|uniref:molybdate ABC transporter substrate-binding protein n=1 Tax=Microbulbifer pacificus TaxID=407164 RepID=UPI001F229111|nr:molybdate ABC transporter substrate-binding protein [Microbulbifer pacificus]
MKCQSWRRIQRCLLLAVAMLSAAVRADELTIAVASNFTAPMQEITRQFEKRSGHKVRLAFGSSGKFFAQISHGAPYHAFFSADQDKPQRLDKLGQTTKDSRFTYAEGKLVLWSSEPGVVDAKGTVLNQGAYNKLAIANPKLAPYGAAALEVLRHLQIEEQSRTHWILGENISQTYQFVASGNADLGLVALSQVLKNGEVTSGSAWIVPTQLYRPIRQDAVILKRGTELPALREFWAFVQSEEARAIIRAYGYNTPAPAASNSNNRREAPIHNTGHNHAE